jgi:dihydrofolate reductase
MSSTRDDIDDRQNLNNTVPPSFFQFNKMIASTVNRLVRGSGLSAAATIATRQQNNIPTLSSTRNFSVKELPWCAPKDSPVRRHPSSSSNGNDGNNYKAEKATIKAGEFKFGIVAAQAKKTRIIGIGGKLPFNVPRDRKIFEALTKNRIVIIGRNTFQEQSSSFECGGRHNLNHVRHAKHCIVVSKTIQSLDELTKTVNNDHEDEKDMLKLASSFEGALEVAAELIQQEKKDVGNDDSNDLSFLLCWVAGGERLYEEALKHKSVSELHLTTIDVDFDDTVTKLDNKVAKFPAKYRWDHNFELLSEEEFPQTSTEPRFVYSMYKRLVRDKPR